MRKGDVEQGELFTYCPGCGGQRVFSARQVAPVEVWRLPDGRVLVNLWSGYSKAVWVELSQEGRRWLGTELLRGLDATTGDTAHVSPVVSGPSNTCNQEGATT